MRIAALTLAAALGLAGAASAQVPTVSVTIGPKLQEEADNYGQRELDFLAYDLQQSVESRLRHAGQAGHYELTITDARPNRPTFKQMGDKPGLSLSSFGNGGAAVEGAYVAPDGSRTPIRYKWYENNIAWSQHSWTWTDATIAFDRLGARLARGEMYAAR